MRGCFVNMMTLDDSGFVDESLDVSVEAPRYSLRRRNKTLENSVKPVKSVKDKTLSETVNDLSGSIVELSKPIHTSTPHRQLRTRAKSSLNAPLSPPQVSCKKRGRPKQNTFVGDQDESVECVEEVEVKNKKHKSDKQEPIISVVDDEEPIVTIEDDEEPIVTIDDVEEKPILPVDNVNVISFDHSHDGLKRQPCKNCSNCLRPDCRKCIFCKDKKKYGGPNIKKQKCQLKEKCSQPSVQCRLCNADVSGFVSLESPKQKVSRKSSSKHDLTPAVEILPDTPAECGFCHQGHQNPPLEAGRMYSINGVVSHYFCMLFTFHGSQLGYDREGLFGYYGEEVVEQMQAGQETSCQVCHKPGATALCSQKQCGVAIHFPCGMEVGATFQFMGNMLVFCSEHRLKQTVVTFPTPPDTDCVICYEEVDQINLADFKRIQAPCCGRHLHRDCVQRFAMSSGTNHFKCPNCNNKEDIMKEFKKHGVYIPQKDAEWELPEQSSFYNFQDMHLREKVCSVKECLCQEEEGRRFIEVDGEYEIVLCKMCGNNGAHLKCAGLNQDNLEHICEDCIS